MTETAYYGIMTARSTVKFIMQYLGGKSKTRHKIAAILKMFRTDDQPYLEPFVGGGWILQEMDGVRFGSDGNPALVALYQALQIGWEPPDVVSEEEWRFYRNTPEAIYDPMQAFARFGCGFGGDWNGGYARSGCRNYAGETKRNILKQLPKIQDVSFSHCAYDEHAPIGMLIYCDPPYASTTAYGAFDGFDHIKFWETMREWSKCNTVIISEYQAPDDFEIIAEFTSRMGLTAEGERPLRIERLFMWRGIK